MLKEENRKIVIITFVVGITFILASVAASWNAFIGKKEVLGILPLIYAIIAIASVSYLFVTAYKLSNTKLFNTYIQKQVSEGRAALLDEISKKEETEKVEETGFDDIPKKAKELIPVGNFKNIKTISKKLLINVANEMNLVQGMLFVGKENTKDFIFSTGYALANNETPANFKLGENLNGEVAKTQELMLIDEIPETYFSVESGLGNAKPGHLCIVPIVSDQKTIAVIELASFASISDRNIKILEQVAEIFSEKIKQIVKA